MVDYAGAIKKPLSDMQTLGISTVIGAIPIVNILIWFFAVENAKRVLNKNASLPSWNADVIFSNIVPALKMLVVGIIYMIPGLVVVGIGLVPIIGGIIAGITSGDTSTLLAGLAAGGIIALVGVLLMLIGAGAAVLGVSTVGESSSGSKLSMLMTAGGSATLVWGTVDFFTTGPRRDQIRDEGFRRGYMRLGADGFTIAPTDRGVRAQVALSF